MRRRGGRKRAIGTRAPLDVPQQANERWSLDFVSDQMLDGRRFRILAVVDDATRECLALVADTSLSGARVARELDTIVAWRGKPACAGRCAERNLAPLARPCACRAGRLAQGPQRAAAALEAQLDDALHLR